MPRLTVKEFKIQYALGLLSTDRRRKMAEALSTPKGILTVLIGDPDGAIRSAAWNNSKIPESMIIEEITKQVRSPRSEVFHSMGQEPYEFWTIRITRQMNKPDENN